ncbi:MULTISPECIES: YggT family protein [Bacillus]|uniref:Cell division protein n=2 Tax=Bacillus TaxID=1386 RepID=A0A0M4G7F8_9BACI|nr:MULTISPECIES: YggT family protein [Bacillus]ALC80983.1 hypothetical protein AM592_04800 [Bacillus gobiensis]MBP1079935.1 YggT family protein [Bacillus capparidis]MED1095322.1 YggT family protein [Bacillus capparidis]
MLMLYQVLDTVITFYMYAIIIYILLSWFPNARESSFGRILGSICEPYLEPFRKIIPPIAMIDISPIVAILVLRMAGEGLRVVFFMFM